MVSDFISFFTGFGDRAGMGEGHSAAGLAKPSQGVQELPAGKRSQGQTYTISPFAPAEEPSPLSLSTELKSCLGTCWILEKADSFRLLCSSGTSFQ